LESVVVDVVAMMICCSVQHRALLAALCRLANAASKNDDMEAAISQVGIEVYSAMDAAIQ
jgi:hypothetical protein